MELGNFHQSTFACQMRLIMAAKASPHTKFYNLNTDYTACKPGATGAAFRGRAPKLLLVPPQTKNEPKKSLLVPPKRKLCPPKKQVQARYHWSIFWALCPTKTLFVSPTRE